MLSRENILGQVFASRLLDRKYVPIPATEAGKAPHVLRRTRLNYALFHAG